MATALELPDIGSVCGVPGEYTKVERREYKDEFVAAQQVTLELGTNYFEKEDNCGVDTIQEFTLKSLEKNLAANFQSILAQKEISQVQYNYVMQTIATAFLCEFKKKRFSAPLLTVSVTAFNPNVTYQGEGANLDFLHRMPLGWVQWSNADKKFASDRCFIRQLKQFIPSPHSALDVPIVYLTTGVEAVFELIR